MAWFRIDDKLHDHPKVRKLRGDRMPALGLWTACGSWSADNLSDGFVPREIVHRFDPEELLAKRLVEVGLWTAAEEDGEDGYRFHQWTEHQPTRADVERRRGEARERMRELRSSRKGSQSVRANSERTDLNTCERTDAHGLDEHLGESGQFDFYGQSKTYPQVDGPVRANALRSSQDVPDPGPARPIEVPNGTSREGRKRPATRLPDTWRPNDSHQKYAVQHGLDIAHEVAQFKAHAEANDRRQASWNGAFRQWLGNAVQYRAKRPLRAVSGGHQTFRNPVDPAAYDEPFFPQEPR